jgi:hypothetical protein
MDGWRSEMRAPISSTERGREMWFDSLFFEGGKKKYEGYGGMEGIEDLVYESPIPSWRRK